MKKLLTVSAMLLALGLVFTSCASKGAKASKAPGIPHPREYVFDLIDGGATINVPKNQYGPNFQATPSFLSLVKKDKPQAGDTVTFYWKATSDIDIDVLNCNAVDNSAAANYWTVLTGKEAEECIMAENVKAGEPFEGSISFTLTTAAKGDFVFQICYPEAVGKAANITFERVCESTDTVAEAASVPKAPKNLNVELEKVGAFTEIKTNHPWINGAQDMAVISNYEGYIDATSLWGDDLPVAGETLHVSWAGVTDLDIPGKVFMRMVDRSAAANWWMELQEFSEGSADDYVILEDVKAGEPFFIEKDYTLSVNPVAEIQFVIWYDYDGTGPGPCFIKKAARPDAK